MPFKSFGCSSNGPSVLTQPVGTRINTALFRYFPPCPGSSIQPLSNPILSAGPVGYLFAPGNNQLNGQQFKFRASGNVASGSNGITSPITTVGIACVTLTNNISTGAPTNLPTVVGGFVTSLVLSQSSDITGQAYPWYFDLNFGVDGDSGLLTLISGSSAMDGVSGTVTPGLALSGLSVGSSTPFAFAVGVDVSIAGEFNSVCKMYQCDLS